MSVDPVDDCTFWYTQEYIATTGDRNWQTRVGAFQLSRLRSSGGLAVTATAAPSSGPIPLAVSLTATASGGTGPYTYAWTFGDGNTGTGATVSHTYAHARQLQRPGDGHRLPGAHGHRCGLRHRRSRSRP